MRVLSLDGVKAADWEGNATAVLGLRPDLGAPLVGEAVPGKPAARAGLAKGDRIVAIDGVADALAGRCRAGDQCQPGRAAHVSRRARRRGQSTSW